MKIYKIKINEEYKLFNDIELEFNDVNIFIGTNGIGKTIMFDILNSIHNNERLKNIEFIIKFNNIEIENFKKILQYVCSFEIIHKIERDKIYLISDSYDIIKNTFDSIEIESVVHYNYNIGINFCVENVKYFTNFNCAQDKVMENIITKNVLSKSTNSDTDNTNDITNDILQKLKERYLININEILNHLNTNDSDNNRHNLMYYYYEKLLSGFVRINQENINNTTMIEHFIKIYDKYKTENRNFDPKKFFETMHYDPDIHNTLNKTQKNHIICQNLLYKNDDLLKIVQKKYREIFNKKFIFEHEDINVDIYILVNGIPLYKEKVKNDFDLFEIIRERKNIFFGKYKNECINGNHECSFGEVEVINFLTLLYSSNYNIIYIDEPCVYLAKQNSNILMSIINEIKDKQIFIITHDSKRLNINNISNLYYFFNSNRYTNIFSYKKMLSINNKINEKLLYESKDIFFSQNIFLVEGIDDKRFIECLVGIQNPNNKYEILEMRGGKSTLPKILENLNVNFKVMYDLDHIFSGFGAKFVKYIYFDKIGDLTIEEINDIVKKLKDFFNIDIKDVGNEEEFKNARLQILSTKISNKYIKEEYLDASNQLFTKNKNLTFADIDNVINNYNNIEKNKKVLIHPKNYCDIEGYINVKHGAIGSMNEDCLIREINKYKYRMKNIITFMNSNVKIKDESNKEEEEVVEEKPKNRKNTK